MITNGHLSRQRLYLQGNMDSAGGITLHCLSSASNTARCHSRWANGSYGHDLAVGYVSFMFVFHFIRCSFPGLLQLTCHWELILSHTLSINNHQGFPKCVELRCHRLRENLHNCRFLDILLIGQTVPDFGNPTGQCCHTAYSLANWLGISTLSEPMLRLKLGTIWPFSLS